MIQELKAANLTTAQKINLGKSRARQVWGEAILAEPRFAFELSLAVKFDNVLDFLKNSRVGQPADERFASRRQRIYFWTLANTIN